MKSITHLFITVLIFLGCSISGCASHQQTGFENYKTYGEKIEDRKVINLIKHRFSTNPTIPQNLIHLSIDRGIIQLSGFVRNMEQANLAILVAMNTPGVKDVIDNLIVLSDPYYAKRRAKAEAYTTKR